MHTTASKKPKNWAGYLMFFPFVSEFFDLLRLAVHGQSNPEQFKNWHFWAGILIYLAVLLMHPVLERPIYETWPPGRRRIY